nr:hypothetical protein [Tanacetum cinerariifolium]
MVAEDDEMSKEKDIDKLMALISLSFKKIYKPTNNNLRTSSNTRRANQDNSPRINRGAGYENQRIGNVAEARETVDQELEAHYMYMAQIQEVSLDAADSGPIFDVEPLQKIDQNDDDNDNDLTNERELLASLIKKLKYEIDDNKNRNTFLETSNKVLIEKLKGENEDFKNKNKSLESSNNRFKEANNKLSETNKLLYNDFKKSQSELQRRNYVEYVSKKEAKIKLYKTREDNELDKVIELENKVKVLDNIVYKTAQSVQTMNMLNNKCRTSFAKHEFLKKAQRANPRLYDIEEMVDDLRYFNSLELEVDSLKSQLETQKTQFFNEIDRLSREYYYADHMNAILGVIPNTSVSIPQLKSNPIKDRVLLNNSQGKKQEVEDHRRNVKLPKNKTYVTACNDSLKANTLNVNFICATCGKYVLNAKHDMCILNSVNSRTKMPIAVPVSTREPKRTVKQSVAKPIRKTVDSESNQKHRNTTRKLYERVNKACSWWYPKFTPSGYT